MKIYKTLLLISFSFIGLSVLTSCSDKGNSSSSDTMSAYEAILTRASVRQYTPEKVSEKAVDSLLRAAMAAPTAVNKQPWQFIVIDDKELLDSLSTGSGGWAPVGRAPLAIVACGDMNLAIEGEGRDFWVQDVSAATENLLVAAHSMGLGAVWCGAYPSAERVEILRNALGLPDYIVPLNIIAIGYPADQPAPKEKFTEEKVHFNRW